MGCVVARCYGWCVDFAIDSSERPRMDPNLEAECRGNCWQRLDSDSLLDTGQARTDSRVAAADRNHVHSTASRCLEKGSPR